MPIPSKGISGSRGSAVIGINKYKSKFVAWLEIMEQINEGFCFKNGYELPERQEEWSEPLNPKMSSIRWGHAFEDAICDLDGGITNREDSFAHKDYPWLTCHIDGFKNGRLVENKTAFDMAYKMGWGEPGSDLIPKSYLVQVQHNMLITGTTEAEINVLVFPKSPAEWEKMGYRVFEDSEIMDSPQGKTTIYNFALNLKQLGYFHKYHVKADPELQQQILDEYLTFWNENVLKQIEPEINGESDIKWLISSPEGEIEATEEMTNLWSEKCDTENEIRGMQDRIYEIKNNFAQLLQIEIASKNVKAGNEDHKLNVYSGSRKLASITRPKKRTTINKKMVDLAKEDNPELYAEMKKTTFLDIFPESVDLTDKQLEKISVVEKELEDLAVILEGAEELPKDFYEKIKNTRLVQAKILKSLKLTKLLSKDSIIKTIQKNKPELFNFFFENGIVEESEGKSSLRMTGNKEEY